MSTVHDVRGRGPLVGALLLFSSALLALIIANSRYGIAYHDFWRATHPLGPDLAFSLQAAVDKGLMTLFFLVIGLELKREVTHGALRHPRAMILPLLAAVGGMVLPAFIYHVINRRGVAAHGWGIPMSTDVAFAAAALAALGRRVPRNLLIFVLALAIVDDVGAILVIALYYNRGVRPLPLVGALLVCVALLVLARRGRRWIWPYLIMGGALWAALWRGGIDPPLAGVLVAVALPGPSDATADHTALARRLERRLAPYVTYGVLPLFALANADLPLAVHDLTAQGRVLLGVFLGLLLGKFCGVGGVSWLATHLRLGDLPSGVAPRHLGGAAWLSGIGFTMALFINTLAFPPGPDRVAGKLAILMASPLAFILGTTWLLVVHRRAAHAP
ncbi:Na+/H+ antiporter NhaA [Acidiferrobacter thiooxydans]|uniref:Na+/H+ antiporter NhaA n=1 Tax=Acidiferrobacter thiooxydans TaxID=163359 RepID=UPI001B862968|nr:Na+/H+ antiporter NhaA [Acidiferrobacter thiooxydans]